MRKKRGLLFVGAHPDDEAFGPGGTLAKYAFEGVEVVYACATRGEVGTVAAEYLQGYASVGDMRWAELTCAAQALGLSQVIHLGYRDSGMPGSPDNHHPQALTAAPLEDVIARIVGVLRDLRPQVVITFNAIGGYRHPDHIAMHEATVQAFHAAADPSQFPERGPAHQAQKLYFLVFPISLLRLAVRVLPVFGQDVRHFGRNRDIDLISLTQVEFPIHAAIRVRGQASDLKRRAVACHRSQLESGPPSGGLLGWLISRIGERETFMRAHPPVNGRLRETDLFAGVT